MSNRINSILELANNEKYVVLNQAIYQGTNYLLMARISEDEQEVLNEIKICEEKLQDGVIGVQLVTDTKLIDLLTKYLIPQQ